jgi:hypothetical protein
MTLAHHDWQDYRACRAVGAMPEMDGDADPIDPSERTDVMNSEAGATAAPTYHDVDEPSPDVQDAQPEGSWGASIFTRSAAIAIIVLFCLPWGAVWMFSGCVSRGPANTLGPVSGWEIAVGTDYEIPATYSYAGAERDLSLDAQPEAFIIPLVALGIVALPFLANAGQIARSTVFGLSLSGSLLIGIIFLAVIADLAVPAHQQHLLGPRDTYGELPGLELNWQFGAWGILISLTVLGVFSIAGWIIERRAKRRQRTAKQRASRIPGLHEHPLHGAAP